MDLVLNVVAFASFAALLAAWVSVPHPGRTVRTAAVEAGAAQAVGAN
jgi:hypothetical protein